MLLFCPNDKASKNKQRTLILKVSFLERYTEAAEVFVAESSGELKTEKWDLISTSDLLCHYTN